MRLPPNVMSAGSIARHAPATMQNALTSDQVRQARALLGWSVDETARRIQVSEAAMAEFEDKGEFSPVIDLDLLRGEFEAAGVLFTSGPPPGARKRGDIDVLRARNHRLRLRIEHFLAGANDGAKSLARRIVLEQAPPAVDDEIETLERVHDNLCLRANALIRAGVAKPADFNTLIWPRASSAPPKKH